MTLPKLKRKARRIWTKSAGRLAFSVLRQIAIVLLLAGLNISGLSAIVGQTNSYFSDTETGQVTVSAGIWMPELLSPRDGAVINGSYVEQRWTPINDATKYIYQSCNNDPDTAGGVCDLRWYEEYSPATPQFIGAKKWASNVANAAYWWRVKVQIGSFTSQWTPAWEIVIDNSHLNKVVINEFLPNAVGADYAPMPNGEWVELYNNKGSDVDTAGWVLYDSLDIHALPVTNSNTNTGNTLIRSGGFLVVYLNGAMGDIGWLNNTGGDTVRLYNGVIGGGGSLIDSHVYTISASEGKSFARIPDGSNNWVDPIPTPGEPNSLDGESATFGLALNEEGGEIPDLPDTLDNNLDPLPNPVSEVIDAIKDVLGLSQTASGSQEIITASGSFEIVASPSEGQGEITNPAPVASGSVEPLAEPPLDSPAGDLTGQALPEPVDNPQPTAGDGSSIQVPTDPAIPAEPVTVEAPTEPAPPPADPPAPAPDPAPAPAPEIPAAPAE